ETGDAGQLLPFVAVPTDRSAGHLSVLHAEERRNGLDAVMPGELELAIVDDPRSGRKRGVILADDGELRVASEPLEHRRYRNARRAVVLDEGDEAGRKRRFHRKPAAADAFPTSAGDPP